MGYDLTKDKIILGEQRRIFFKRKNIASFMFPLMVLMGLVFTVSLIAPAFAIETTKASALILEEMRADALPSMTENTPLNSLDNHCTSYLTAHLSPDADRRDFQSSLQTTTGDRAVPMALGLVLGVRIALGPRETVKTGGRVQAGPEFRTAGNGGHPRALAIAAYRSCKNEQTLKLQNNNKKENGSH